MQAAWCWMAVMALVAVLVTVPRELCVVYAGVFCILGLWLVEGESKRRPAVKSADGILDNVRIGRG